MPALPEFPRVEEMVVKLHQTGRIAYARTPEEFTELGNGRMSPHVIAVQNLASIDYGNERIAPVPVFERARDLAAKGLIHALNTKTSHGYSHIIGLPGPMALFSGFVAARGRFSALSFRPGEMGVLDGNPTVDGLWHPDERVVPIDSEMLRPDVMLEHVPILEAAGLRVDEVAVLVDREEGGTEAMGQLGYGVVSAVGMRDVNQILRDAGEITSDQYGFVNDYLDRWHPA